jgi:hypothetical protein
MNKFLYATAFAAGLLAVAWVGAGYAASQPLALTMTLLIAAFYALGAVELQRFRRDTGGLAGAVGALSAAPQPPASLADWLATLPAALRSGVRLRVEGQRVALPGPALTPYLVGLLVLLGMLGTFLGMVVTLKGTVIALEGSVELQALRSALAAPVRGLGLAFGTSVAGVCASAMLGLMSTLARRERLQAAQQLDGALAGPLRAFSPAHQRDEQLRLMQAQAQLLPALVERLDGLMAQLAQQQAAGAAQLAEGQAKFHQGTEAAYRQLAASVERALQASVAETTRAATERVQGLVGDALAGAAQNAAALHERAAHAAQQQLDALSRQVLAQLEATAGRWSAALERHDAQGDARQSALHATLQQVGERFDTRSAALLQSLAEQQAAARRELAEGFAQQAAALADTLAARDEQRLAAWRAGLEQMTATLQHEWRAAGEQTLAQQQAVCATLEGTARGITEQAREHAQATIAEIARLMQTAADAPRVAAEVIGQLREQLSASTAHDNALLEERQRLLAAMATLVDTVRGQADAQRAAVDTLVARAAAHFDAGAGRLDAAAQAGSERLETLAAQMAGGAAELAALGEAFGDGVQRFGDANERLLAQLQRAEAALDKAGERSDAQLAYYVAQARELIDLSLLSQKRIVEEMRQLGRAAAAPELATDEAA